LEHAVLIFNGSKGAGWTLDKEMKLLLIMTASCFELMQREWVDAPWCLLNWCLIVDICYAFLPCSAALFNLQNF
jgi:hypothetical protein